MIEIKFRAWDVFNGEYLYSDTYENMSDFWLSIEKRMSGGNHVVVEQLANQKDKNGKEIYGNDKIRLTGAEIYSDENVTTDYDWSLDCVVKFEGFMWIAECKDVTWIPFSDFEYNEIEIEVIGHIHEN